LSEACPGGIIPGRGPMRRLSGRVRSTAARRGRGWDRTARHPSSLSSLGRVRQGVFFAVVGGGGASAAGRQAWSPLSGPGSETVVRAGEAGEWDRSRLLCSAWRRVLGGAVPGAAAAGEGLQT